MGSEKQTAVNLTNFAQEIKTRLEVIYKLKLLISTSLVLVDCFPKGELQDLMQIVASDNKEKIKAVQDEYAALFASRGQKRR